MWKVLLVLTILTQSGLGMTPIKDHRTFAKNVSSLLDSLLDKNRYDKRIRPGLGGKPVLVTVNMLIKSMGPVSETDEFYAMDCYFRQTWEDKRLQFQFPGMNEPLSLPWLFLERVWKPDTFFLNGKKSHLHRITVPNKFLRVKDNGVLTYSMRLTIMASCPMHLRKFPLDTQKCPLVVGSYGYTKDDVLYEWQETDSVVEEAVELAQYDLINVTTEPAQIILRGKDEYSMIKVTFLMKRHTGYFLLQVFAPCCLIVCCSWVSFWIDPDAVPARVTLGVTTVLSMTTMGFGGRAQMPKVSYATALDWFVILCFSFVFAVMVEYAVINFLDKITTDIKRILEKRGVRKKEKTPPSAEPEPMPAEPTPSADPVVPKLVVELAPTPKKSDQEEEPIYADVADVAPASSSRTYGTISRPDDPETDSPTSRRALLAVPGADNVLEMCDDDEEPPLDTLEALEVHIRGSMVELSETLGSFTSETRQSLRRCLRTPFKAWADARFLPREEDVTELIMSDEPPDKFSKIDIGSRRYFPITFFILFSIYWIMYLYYITDEFPARVTKDLLTKRGHK